MKKLIQQLKEFEKITYKKSNLQLTEFGSCQYASISIFYNLLKKHNIDLQKYTIKESLKELVNNQLETTNSIIKRELEDDKKEGKNSLENWCINSYKEQIKELKSIKKYSEFIEFQSNNSFDLWSLDSPMFLNKSLLDKLNFDEDLISAIEVYLCTEYLMLDLDLFCGWDT